MDKNPRGINEARIPLSTPNTTGATHPGHHTCARHQQHSMQDFLHLKKHVQPPGMSYGQLYSLLL